MHVLSLNSEGEGIVSIDGYKVFVTGALPGEIVDITLTEKRKNFGRASIGNILQPSPHRVTPICPLFEECGGCSIMHLAYAEQLKVKRQKVVDALERIGNLEVNVAPCRPSPKPLFYRNKIQMPIHGGKMGLFKKRSHDIVDVEKCYIQEEGELFPKLRSLVLGVEALRYIIIKTGVYTNEVLIILVTDGSVSLKPLAKKIMALSPNIQGVVENINTRDDSVVLSSHFTTLEGRPILHEKLLGKTFSISPSSFFQVNTFQTELLISYVLGVAKLDKNKKVIDPFCGVGTFSLFAALEAKEVKGFEIVSSAILDAKHNAKINGIENASFEVGRAEKSLSNNFDVAILNPPRKGLEKELIDSLSIPSLIYISCDPATLSRDLAHLVKKGYQINSVQPFDMFPQTMHVETVVDISQK